MSPLSANEFSKRLSAILNRNMKSMGVKKSDIADAVGVSQSYLTQVTNTENKYNKRPPTADLLWEIVSAVKSQSPQSHIDKDIERLIVLYGSREYIISYHVKRASVLVGDIQKVIDAFDDLCKNP
jgi:transcriptional regulator with XRE-family HTH domain